VAKAKIPDIQVIIYGSVSVKAYYEECLALRKELELEDTVVFAGHTTNIAAAYGTGDIVALTSISEAFPYSVVEAMMCGRAVISTDVGGIKEAIGDYGVMVTPRDYEALAEGMVELLQNTEMRNHLAWEGRERALSYFTLDKVLESHELSYRRLASGWTEESAVAIRPVSAAKRAKKQRLLAERAYAFYTNELYMDAVRHFKLAVLEAPESPAAPALLIEAAAAYNQMGMFDQAFLEIEKHQALAILVDSRKSA